MYELFGAVHLNFYVHYDTINKNYHFGNLKIKRRMRDIEIQYKDKKVEKLCTDLKKAKKDLPANVAEKLHALINLIESADNLKDIDELQIYHLHPLHGQREGQYALDVAGRKSGYRLVVIPLDADGNGWKEKDVNVVYKSTEVIIAWEVSNHYE